jgi:hypothetical protein
VPHQFHGCEWMISMIEITTIVRPSFPSVPMVAPDLPFAPFLSSRRCDSGYLPACYVSLHGVGVKSWSTEPEKPCCILETRARETRNSEMEPSKVTMGLLDGRGCRTGP